MRANVAEMIAMMAKKTMLMMAMLAKCSVKMMALPIADYREHPALAKLEGDSVNPLMDRVNSSFIILRIKIIIFIIFLVKITIFSG